MEEVNMGNAVHKDLFEVLCLLKRARNIIHEIKADEELQDHYQRLDGIQTNLNDEAGWIAEMIGDIMSMRLDDLCETIEIQKNP